jgi:hypothetical protein
MQWAAGAKRPGHEAYHSPPSSAEVKNAWSYTFTPQYASMVRCSVKKARGHLYLLLYCLRSFQRFVANFGYMKSATLITVRNLSSAFHMSKGTGKAVPVL